MNTWFGFCYNQRSLFLKIIQNDDKNTSKMFPCSIICNSRKCSVFITFLLLLLHAYWRFVYCCAFDICFLYIYILYFYIFLWDPTWFCPAPIALSLPLLCADFLCLSLESNLSTCSLISKTCIYICLYLHFSWKKPVNLLSHQQNLYLYSYSYFSWKQPVNLLSHLQKLLCLE